MEHVLDYMANNESMLSTVRPGHGTMAKVRGNYKDCAHKVKECILTRPRPRPSLLSKTNIIG